MIDIKQMLEETTSAILELNKAHIEVPQEAMDILEILQRCYAAETKLKTIEEKELINV